MQRRRAAIWGPRRLGCLTGAFNLAPTMSNNSVFTKKKTEKTEKAAPRYVWPSRENGVGILEMQRARVVYFYGLGAIGSTLL